MMPGLMVPVSTDVLLNWDYGPGNPRIQRLRDATRHSQWNELTEVEWNRREPPDSGTQSAFGRAAFANSSLARYGDSMWARFQHEQQSWMISQFLHGEQSALVVSARLAEVLPDVDGKSYAAIQAAEEARHVAVFARYANERVPSRYAVSESFERLIEQILRDRQWDIQALGMHIMVESLALAAFRLAAFTFEDPLIRKITQLTARDEARHVSFGVLLLDDLYARMSAAELRYREDFVLEAADLLSRRYLLTEIWDRLEIDAAEGMEFTRSNPMMVEYRSTVFARVIHSLEQVSLMTERVRLGLDRLGLIAGAAKSRKIRAG